jgi:hypothetical protein
MVPADYQDFLVAVVTASASFIGLLFVAVSLVTDTNGKSPKRLAKENAIAEGSYTGLINLFFVSLFALTPHAEIGHVMAIMGLLGLAATASLFYKGRKNGLMRGIMGISTVVYLLELIFGIHVILNGNKLLNTSIFLTIVFSLFATALARAWELTGIREHQ